jgi:spermidine synthase
MDEVVTLAREATAHGEVVLRRRGPVLELVVDGAFAMDSVHTATEELLAATALRRRPAPRRVLVGGLGLGYTTRAVLAAPSVERVDVVELAEPLVRWSREGLAPELAGLEGRRCRLHVADVADVLARRAGPSGPWDLVLLDVDNGPGFLVHAGNAGLYEAPAMARARAALAPGGVLAVWSSHVAPTLLAALEAVAGPADVVEEEVVPVARDGRTFDYALYVLARGPRSVSGHPRSVAGFPARGG